jgi:hypothetical protein
MKIKVTLNSKSKNIKNRKRPSATEEISLQKIACIENLKQRLNLIDKHSERFKRPTNCVHSMVCYRRMKARIVSVKKGTSSLKKDQLPVGTDFKVITLPNNMFLILPK